MSEMIRYSTNVNGIQVQASYDEKAVSEIFLPFLKHIERLQSEKNRRILVMLAAPPGAGKTTLLRTIYADVPVIGKSACVLGIELVNIKQIKML